MRRAERPIRRTENEIKQHFCFRFAVGFLQQLRALAQRADVAHEQFLEHMPQRMDARAFDVAALETDQIQGGMTTEPTISRILKAGDGTVMVDMRTAEGAKAALGGVYPASSLYMSTDYVNSHKEIVQKLANAFVKTMKWINTHTAAEIADKMPKEYYVGDKEAYVKALEAGKGMYTPDGLMPAGGPETVLAVLSGFSKNIKGKTIDLSKTYTTEFVKAAQ